MHIIEARNLAGRDRSGTSDPAVFVKAFGQQQRTSSKEKDNAPVWDEHLFFEGHDLSLDALNKGAVEVRVYDMNTLGRWDLIGQHEVGLSHVYYEPDHELRRRWVSLSAPAWAREGVGIGLGGALERTVGTITLVDGQRDGVQGYVKLSMTPTLALALALALTLSLSLTLTLTLTRYVKLSLTLLGPGDAPRMRGAEEEGGEEEEESAVLIPPTIKRELLFLCVGVLRAEQLPDMDTTLAGGYTTKGLDAYVVVRFNGYAAQSATIKSKSPAWFHEFWVPVLAPSCGQLVTIEVMDRDRVGRDDVIDTLTL